MGYVKFAIEFDHQSRKEIAVRMDHQVNRAILILQIKAANTILRN